MGVRDNGIEMDVVLDAGVVLVTDVAFRTGDEFASGVGFRICVELSTAVEASSLRL